VAERRQASALVWPVPLGLRPSLVQDGPVPLGLQASPPPQQAWLVLRVSPEPVPVWRELPF
jgi:hypothetical protein